jgi:hypothetical protein
MDKAKNDYPRLPERIAGQVRQFLIPTPCEQILSRHFLGTAFCYPVGFSW